MLKKVLALALAGAMVIGSMSLAFAAGEKQIHVQGIKAADTVYTYKVIKMNRTTGKWEWNIDGMTEAELTEITGKWEDGQYKPGSISEATAAKMANIVKGLVSSGTVAEGDTLDVNGATDAEEGLYCVLVTAGDADTVYNPGFAAIQYTQDGATENIASSIDFATLTYSDTAKVKKSTIDVTKKAASGGKGQDLGATTTDNATTANVGDVVTFTVNTNIPAFGQNFTQPKYIISDEMSEGLEFQEFTSIKVDNNTVDTTSGKVGEDTYIKTIDTDDQEWTLTFDEAYLLKNKTGLIPVEIIYTAKVTNAAIANINPDTNTVTVEFSNNPKDLNDSKKIKDETRHYTFSIDMDLLGDDEWETSEFVKIGVDNDGNPITESKTMDNGKVTNPLAGAIFKIFTDSTGRVPYSNDLFTAGEQFTTTADGKLKIKGLDQGDYWLIEQSAPEGYIPNKTPIPVNIVATYKTISVDPDGTAGTGDEYTYEALDTYTITINGTTSTYTMTNSGTNKDKKVSPSDSTQEWPNTKGIELPSTGGIGTTLFYAGGAVLVLLAGVLLVSKRRIA